MLSIHFEVVDNLIGNPPAHTSPEPSNENNNKEQNLLDTPPKEKPKTQKDKVTVKKAKTVSSKDPVYLTDFNFKPTDNKSLKDFYNEYTIQEILKISEISTNHIYSCYRQLSIKVPSFPQTLNDTKKHKGWLDVSNTNDIKVTRTGINFIEHDLAKKIND